jgi:hypothetical protein
VCVCVHVEYHYGYMDECTLVVWKILKKMTVRIVIARGTFKLSGLGQYTCMQPE